MAPTLRLRALVPRASMAGLRRMSTVPSWATVDPFAMSTASPAVGRNLVGGKWCDAAAQHSVVDPLNGEAFVKVPNTTVGEIGPFVERMASCPRSGVHNPIKNVGRYLMLGEVMVKGAHELGKPEVAEFFAHLIHRLVPKSKAQCAGEPAVTRKWMENYGSDQVGRLVRVRVRVRGLGSGLGLELGLGLGPGSGLGSGSVLGLGSGSGSGFRSGFARRRLPGRRVWRRRRRAS